MGDLLRDAAPEVARLYFGPAPKPGQSRVVSRQEVKNRLERARVSAKVMRMPSRLRVKRLSQSLSEVKFSRLVRQSVQAGISAGVTIRDIRVPGGLLLGQGEVRVKLNKRIKYRDGWQTVMAQVHVDGTKVSAIPVSVRLEQPKRGDAGSIVIERGAQVTVVVRKGGVAIKTRALAQEAGTLGGVIAVLPQSGRKLIRAKVLNAHTVEMHL
tara:strand:- start:208 stop:840 length:633 start_codon:yes stop_codon:yes gene_type:complete